MRRLLVGLLVAAAVVMSGSPVTGADVAAVGAKWSIQHTRNPPVPTGGLSGGVSCASATVCTAVGYYNNSAGTSVTLAEVSDGTNWSVEPTPNPKSAEASYLDGVSCISAAVCTAVGSYDNSAGTSVPLAEARDGTSWSVQSTPDPTGAQSSYLYGVSCVSATVCTAVGHDDIAGTSETLAEHWNGTTWSVQPTPDPTGAQSSYLYGVSCVSAMACTAVGYYDSTGTTVTLAETWNGTSWSVQATPNPKGSGAGDSELVGVSCASDVACTAVGNYDNAPLAEAWNGTNWSVQSLPNPVGAEASFLGGISCTSAAACTAVGHYFNSFLSFMTLAETWNGTSWSVQPTPNPTGAALTGLYGVACTSATACAAVGSYSNRAGTSVSLAEAWNGTSWSLQSTPNPTGAEASFLDAVSCATAGACTAVGSHVNSSGTSVTLAEEWSGTSWSLQSTPNPAGAKGSELSGVACALATACIAVGHYDDSAGKSVTLAEDWNGTSWSVQSTPNPAGAEGSELSGVACASAAGCIAVGSYSNSAGKGVTLAEEWNGTSWSVQSTPNPSGAKGSELSGVACASAAACTAVGSYTNSAGTSVTLAEARNGTSWSVQPSPNPKGAAAASLYGVSCLSATACTAVGSYTNGTGTGVTLAEDWNGTRWSVQSTPNPKGAVAGELDGVSCTAATACTAVGYFGSSAGTSGTLAEAWNGKSWSVQSTPDPKAATDSYLGSVACAAPATCTAAGYFSNSAGEPVTLAEARAG